MLSWSFTVLINIKVTMCLFFPAWSPKLTPYTGKLEGVRMRVYVCLCYVGVCVMYVWIAPQVFPNLNIKQTVVTKLIAYLSSLKGKGEHYERNTSYIFFLKPSLFVPHYFPSLVLPPSITSESGFLKKFSCLLKNNLKCLSILI